MLDLGCGAGHELVVLAQHGVRAVGVDPSAQMLAAAATRSGEPLVRADGLSLPFAAGSFSGCWLERVLQHVEDPNAVLAEVVRCVEPGGLVTIFEPDWTSLTVQGRRVPATWTTAARQPAIGATAGDLLRGLGCSIHDRVEERSWWTYDTLARIVGRAAAEAAAGPPARHSADAQIGEIAKILWVASTPA